MDKLEPTSGVTMNITPEQLMAVVMLRNHPAVDFATVNSHKSGNINVGISSNIDANQDEIDDALQVIFPTMLYSDDKPYVCDRDDGTSSRIFGIAVRENRVRISLHMVCSAQIKEAPAPTGALGKHSQPQCTTEVHETQDDLCVLGVM